jgi:hypothetical protein
MARTIAQLEAGSYVAQSLGFWGNVIQQCRRKFSRNQPGRSKPACLVGYLM